MIKSTIPQGFWPPARELFEQLESTGPLPFIRGVWYFVDPTSGSNAAGGKTVDQSLASIEEAYERCISGAGDGICVISRGTGTSSQTTSYLTQELTWSKHGITTVGVCAPTTTYQRARIANQTKTTTSSVISQAAHSIDRETGSFVTDGWEIGMKGVIADSGSNNNATFTVTAVTALSLTVSETLNVQAKAAVGSCVLTSYMVNLITVSGSNNAFMNLMFWNGGTGALEIGGVVVTGHRNYFGNCHIVGGAGAAAAATKYSLKLDACQENCFAGGTIGSDTFSHGDNADVEVILNGAVARNRFEGCELLSFTSAGTAHGAVKSVNTSGGSPTMFKACMFNSMLSSTTPAAAFLSSGSVDKIGAPYSILMNFTAWGAGVYVAAAASAAAAGGGIATKS